MRAWWHEKVVSVRRLLRMAIEESSSPRELALSIGLGALVGSSPLIGLHSVVALGAASLFRLNRLAAFVGSNVSFGPLMAILAWTELVVGCRLLGTQPLAGADAVAAAKDNLLAWWLGYSLIGPTLASTLAAVAWVVARRRIARVAAPPDA